MFLIYISKCYVFPYSPEVPHHKCMKSSLIRYKRPVFTVSYTDHNPIVKNKQEVVFRHDTFIHCTVNKTLVYSL